MCAHMCNTLQSQRVWRDKKYIFIDIYFCLHIPDKKEDRVESTTITINDTIHGEKVFYFHSFTQAACSHVKLMEILVRKHKKDKTFSLSVVKTTQDLLYDNSK